MSLEALAQADSHLEAEQFSVAIGVRAISDVNDLDYICIDRPKRPCS